MKNKTNRYDGKPYSEQIRQLITQNRCFTKIENTDRYGIPPYPFKCKKLDSDEIFLQKTINVIVMVKWSTRGNGF